MCIVTGPNIDMAIKLIKRMKNIFETKLGLLFTNKETVLELNGCTMKHFLPTIWIHLEHWTILNSFYWTNLISGER